MSDYKVCTQCGAEIEDSGIQFRGQVFCSDECCEEYETDFQAKDEPEIDELDPDDDEIEALDEDLDEDLGYREKENYDEDLLDDDFDIKPEDF